MNILNKLIVGPSIIKLKKKSPEEKSTD